eukprot:GSMAST32.ASY1.ANO1.2682.1 assembled CDS
MTGSCSNITNESIKNGLVCLYYLYTEVNDPAAVASAQTALCAKLSLAGRIRISRRGINGTVGGTSANIYEYMRQTEDMSLFESTNIDWKLSESDGPDASVHFEGKKLRCRVVKEICSLGMQTPIDLKSNTAGIHLSPQEWHSLLDTGDFKFSNETNLHQPLDTNFGTNSKVILPNTRNFAAFPQWLDENASKLNLKNKRVAMYCTGGIRCETASALMKRHGVEDVFQLKGGIHRYLESFACNRVKGNEIWQHGLFRGSNFTFDGRGIARPVSNDCKKPTIIGKCEYCAFPNETYDRHTGRCELCRSLVLLCNGCLNAAASTSTVSTMKNYKNNKNSGLLLYCSSHSEWRGASTDWLNKKLKFIKNELEDNLEPRKKSSRRSLRKMMNYINRILTDMK